MKRKFKIIKSKSQIEKENHPELYIIDADEKIARGIIASLKNNKFKGNVGVFGRDNVFNRRALETLKIDFLISPEREDFDKKFKRKDTLKQRDSGLNHILARIAKEKNISIVIDFYGVKEMKDIKQKAVRLARVIQNIKICRKAKCKILIWDLSRNADKRGLESFGYSLGMSSQQVRVAV